MKTISIQTIGNSREMTQKFNIHSSTGTDKIIGTAINEIFRFNTLLKSLNDKGAFKANEPLAVIISTEDSIILDTFELLQNTNVQLKFGNSAKSKRKFAHNLNCILDYSLQEIQVVTRQELESNLDDLIEQLES